VGELGKHHPSEVRIKNYRDRKGKCNESQEKGGEGTKLERRKGKGDAGQVRDRGCCGWILKKCKVRARGGKGGTKKGGSRERGNVGELFRGEKNRLLGWERKKKGKGEKDLRKRKDTGGRLRVPGRR